MTKHQSQVLEFMRKCPGIPTPDKPTMPSKEMRSLRVKLIAEELLELCRAFNCDIEVIGGELTMCVAYDWPKMDTPNALAGVADATSDLRYVVTGTDVACGIDGEPIDEEVHRSNMTKFIDGHMREDGKWIKGPGYSRPDLLPIIRAQMEK